MITGSPPALPRPVGLGAKVRPKVPGHPGGGTGVRVGRASGRALVAALLILLLGTLRIPAAGAAEADEQLAELKVAYIYNFTRFVQWPEVPPGRPFIIGVIGDPVVEEALKVLERDGKRVSGRHIQVRGHASPDGVEASDILFLGGAATDRLETVLRRTAGKPILLISDTPGLVGRGVAIELFRKRDIFRKTERLRFRIDPKALQGRGLLVSAQLYDVAEVWE